MTHIEKGKEKQKDEIQKASFLEPKEKQRLVAAFFRGKNRSNIASS